MHPRRHRHANHRPKEQRQLNSYRHKHPFLPRSTHSAKPAIITALHPSINHKSFPSLPPRAALLVLVAAIVIFVAEHDAQPDKFSSIPASMWWAVVTLTTVGYGDVFPITAAGKIMAACLAFLGIGMFALPTGIISSGFMEEICLAKQRKALQRSRLCPHCGKNIEFVPDED
ncbi:MAG: two pore domain potassium channel family protein [Candidatus Hydrogenedentes bacterium]|nr:two pore domain potassium channel family protein [Candidatus Hydrogenedentota bacterium]